MSTALVIPENEHRCTLHNLWLTNKSWIHRDFLRHIRLTLEAVPHPYRHILRIEGILFKALSLANGGSR